MSAPRDEAFRGFGSFGDSALGGSQEAPRARGRTRVRHWRSHVAAILAACGAIFASYLDGWSLHALRTLDLQPTPSGPSGLVNATSNDLDNGNDFNGLGYDFNGSAINTSGKNDSGKNDSGINDTVFNSSAENFFHYNGRTFKDIAFNGLTLNSSAFDSHVFDSPTFDELALNNSANNDFPVKDSVFNDPSFSNSAFNMPAFYDQLSNRTDFINPPFNNDGLNGHPFVDWPLNSPDKNDSALNVRAENVSALDDRAKNGFASNGTALHNRTEKDFALNGRADSSSAFKDRVGNGFPLNTPDLTERDNSSDLNTPILNESDDNGPALYDIGENDSASNDRYENAPPLNNIINKGSALNDPYLNDPIIHGYALSSPSLDDRDDNGSDLKNPSINDRDDNRPPSNTHGDKGHAFNSPAGPALRGNSENRPFSKVGDAIRTSKDSTTDAGALEGFWSFNPSLLHAMMPVGTALAAWAFGRGADHVGRRSALLVSGLFGALAWLLLFFNRSTAEWVCASRILVGIQRGAIFTVFPVYVAEIAHPRSRGLISSMLCVAVALGRLLWTVSGHQGLWWAGMVPLPALALQWLLYRYMPETPDFLAHMGRLSEAVDVCRQLHGAQSETASEMMRLERLMGQETENEDDANEAYETNDTNVANETNVANDRPATCVNVELLKLKRRLQEAARRRQEKSRRRAIAVSAGLFVLAPLAATDVLRFYVEEYTSKLGESEFSVAAVIGILELTALLFSAGFVDYMGRRALFFISTLGLAIIHSGLSVIAGHDKSSSQWLLILLSGLFVAHDIGLGSVPWVVLSDLLPAKGRAHLSGVIVLLNSSVISALIYLFPIFHSNVGDKWTFISLVLISLIINIYVGHTLRETKKRTLEQIQKELQIVGFPSGNSYSEQEWP